MSEFDTSIRDSTIEEDASNKYCSTSLSLFMQKLSDYLGPRRRTSSSSCASAICAPGTNTSQEDLSQAIVDQTPHHTMVTHLLTTDGRVVYAPYRNSGSRPVIEELAERIGYARTAHAGIQRLDTAWIRTHFNSLNYGKSPIQD
ncbi:hypothetical protein Pmar_PMAR029346 [Perkinsus marinus ATCC 50983]|uniref:Uncharacterized protein n=1 Tax=Perkinsus marinus (strain ATCC 50983 / TXsc) TaxID=423536 RepID=C5KMW6_PERM5|nr:hypothetical protein Pmar_PMAR029346 [Perkinsus marinus ATCC 50983]EER14274.1 hypothetical protein Pmar_PMAR029346 [Perkinsus marinus ATCC 50983]|eukprot:XP_002782479.1 hypothetical protein Pmar_PMAR029346 [Perkinsus marinus ATCC 50983]